MDHTRVAFSITTFYLTGDYAATFHKTVLIKIIVCIKNPVICIYYIVKFCNYFHNTIICKPITKKKKKIITMKRKKIKNSIVLMNYKK